MADVPHFALPFRFVNGRACTVEQGSDDEIGACITAVLRYPLGSRPALPAFGVQEQAFEQGGPHLAEIRAALAEWEPRADTTLQLDDPRLLDFVAKVRVGFDQNREA